MKVGICISTYQRLRQLSSLLRGLARQEFERDVSPEIEIFVVDNDAKGSARVVCETFRPQCPYLLHYKIEPQRGISFARNESVSLATTADFIAFIDDDEVPDNNWLDELLRIQQTYKADVVWGPVVPVYEDPEIPEWVISGGFFVRKNFPNGASLDKAACHNTLVKASILRELGPEPFDPQFALTGGEDTDLFMRLNGAGFKIFWAANAIVRESVPLSRTTMKWILQRGFRAWSSHSLCERKHRADWRNQSIRFVKGLALIGIGIARLPTAIFGKAAFVKSLLYVARGCGAISGLFGYSFEEYRSGNQYSQSS